MGSVQPRAIMMTDRRELEGTGYHYIDYDGDGLLVDQWIKRPDDLKGQSLTVGKLLPLEFRYMDLHNHYDGGYPEKSPPQKFRFRITVEIDRIAVNNK
jgi:hypothetical protein